VRCERQVAREGIAVVALVARLMVLIEFTVAFNWHADVFFEPPTKVDQAAAFRTERHCPGLFRIEFLPAGWTKHQSHIDRKGTEPRRRTPFDYFVGRAI
jgi:hypothetical protein